MAKKSKIKITYFKKDSKFFIKIKSYMNYIDKIKSKNILKLIMMNIKNS